MINEIRNTVLFILNKENRGFVTPSEFNQFADLAQMSIFEDDFHAYSKALAKQNARMYHDGYSDIPKHLRERIDVFTKYLPMTYNVSLDRWIVNDPDLYRMVNISNASGDDIEEVSKLELNRILKSNLLSPTSEYQVYIKDGSGYNIIPNTGSPEALYIRRPKRPKWTYVSVGGNPVFNPSATDYQDIELHPSCEMELIIKILSYCGLSIREADVMQASQAVQMIDEQKQGL